MSRKTSGPFARDVEAGCTFMAGRLTQPPAPAISPGAEHGPKRSAPPTRLSYIRPSARLATARSLAGKPALAVCSSFLAIGIRRCTSARPFGLSSTTTSRLLFAERLRVTSPLRTSRLTSRDMVEASIEVMRDEIDLALLAVVGERRQHPPHGDAQPVLRQRVGGEAVDQRKADAIDQIRQVVAEIEMGAFGHGTILAERCGSDADLKPAQNIAVFIACSTIAFTTIAIALLAA